MLYATELPDVHPDLRLITTLYVVKKKKKSPLDEAVLLELGVT